MPKLKIWKICICTVRLTAVEPEDHLMRLVLLLIKSDS